MVTAKGMKEIPILLHIGWTLDGSDVGDTKFCMKSWNASNTG